MDADARLEIDLRYAAARNQLDPQFRPVVDGRSGAVVGFAVEPTWAHPRRGRLRAGAFLPLADRLRLASDIERWILERACETVARWGGEATDALAFLLFPCSASTAADTDVVAHARASADMAGLPPDRLVLLFRDLESDAAVDAHAFGLQVGVAVRSSDQPVDGADVAVAPPSLAGAIRPVARVIVDRPGEGASDDLRLGPTPLTAATACDLLRGAAVASPSTPS